MNHYKALYLPTDDPLTDGCRIITRSNEILTFDAEEDHTPEYLSFISRAELFLVDMQFNTPVPLGIISPKAKWVRNGDDILKKDIEEWIWDRQTKQFLPTSEPNFPELNDALLKMSPTFIRCWRIVCPMCSDLH